MNKTKQAEPGRIRYSITSKLNSKLFFRLVGIYMSFNIVVFAISCAAVIIYCEHKLVGVFNLLAVEEPPGGEWLSLAGMSISEVPEYTIYYGSDWRFSRLLPYETEHAARGFRAEADGFENTIRSIEYVVNLSREGRIYEVTLYIGPALLFFVYAFIALHAFEILSILSRCARDRRMVRKTLDPISELARAAQSLNYVSRKLEHDKALALAGRLDGIDVSKLDTRIQVDDLQEELKNVAVAINGMLDRITESYAAQARFVSDASHELRTPISVIQGYANLLDRWGKEDEKALAESISAIKDEAENMKALVEQLLFLARGDSNTIRLEEESFSLPELAGEVVSEMRMIVGERVFKVNEEAVTVTADKSLIKQALRILVDNAVKYTDAGGEITVAVSQSGDCAKLSVSDNGIGISPEILPRVFDRFVRADESRTRATGGAGLGLSIAQWIAVRHNGHIEVISREGIGTRIILVIPAGSGAS